MPPAKKAAGNGTKKSGEAKASKKRKATDVPQQVESAEGQKKPKRARETKVCSRDYDSFLEIVSSCRNSAELKSYFLSHVYGILQKPTSDENKVPSTEEKTAKPRKKPQGKKAAAKKQPARKTKKTEKKSGSNGTNPTPKTPSSEADGAIPAESPSTLATTADPTPSSTEMVSVSTVPTTPPSSGGGLYFQYKAEER
ncbi:hypothetical protein M501DRAFT_597260 [Patellaria atrata CBS 101060]|uniref:Uncharacterized protein n=1 Tax=Patellaria atrata CBS 101060 TaxID=1346257 RepID=A0A9P4VLL9_9PEZI|nr:hypothetical protein M501DRAFT_597260 [Patellaria atrata CBS 101060]